MTLRVTSIVHFSLSIIMGAISVATLFFIEKFPTPGPFIIILITGLSMISLGLFHINRRGENRSFFIILSTATLLAFASILLIIEHSLIRTSTILLSGVAMFILTEHVLHAKNAGIMDFTIKPLRRMVMMILAFQAFAFSSTLYALNLFFPAFSFWIVAIIEGCIFSLLAFAIWRMYFQISLSRAWLWCFIISFAMLELVWVIHLLPFGYFISGFIASWLWYLLQLFIRFHLSPQRIIWKKQRIFLIVSGILLILFSLLFIRWI